MSFLNDTDRPVNLSTWHCPMSGLAVDTTARVRAGGRCRLPPSATDEFLVYSSEGREYIGKFRLDPAADGRRCWTECDHHILDHTAAAEFRLRRS
jgi:hypothetical protein